MKSIISILLIAAGLLLFFFFTKEKLAELKSTQLEVQKLQIARENAKNLKKQKDNLLAVKNEIKTEDILKMTQMLPYTIENVKLIIDFDKILQNMVEERGTLNLYKASDVTETGAKKISIENPKITESSANTDTSFDSSKLGVSNFSFSVTLTYSDFIEFIKRIEKSTRIMDIESISFSSAGINSGSDPIYTFSISLKTYWLKYVANKDI